MEREEIFAALVVGLLALSVALLSLGVGNFLTGESYSNALRIEAIAKGEPAANAGIFHQFAAFAYARAAAFSGAQEFDVGLLVLVLKLIPGLAALAAGIGAYFMLRGIFGREVAAAGAILLACSLSLVPWGISGIVMPEPFGLALFVCGAAFALQAVGKGDWRYAPGAVLMGVAFLAWNGALLAYAAFAAGLVAQAAYNEARKGRDAGFLRAAAISVALPLLFIPLASLSGLPGEFSAAVALKEHFLIFPLLLLALLLAIIKAWGRLGVEEWDALALGMFAGSLAVAGFSPLAALPGFAVAACVALRELPRIARGKNAAALVFGAAAAFAAMIFLLGMMDPAAAVLFAVLAGVAGGFIASMYSGARLGEYAQVTVAAVLLLTSVSAAVMLAHYQPEPVNAETGAALAWVKANAEPGAKIAGAGSADAFAFISQREAENDTDFVARWLLSNASASELGARGIGYLVLDAGAFDGIEDLKNRSGRSDVKIDSYLFMGFQRDPETGATYAAFYSYSGRFAYLPVESNGVFIQEGDAIIIESGGAARKVPVARFVALKDADGRVARLIYPIENYNVNLFSAYFGSVSGLAKAYPEGDGVARVFRVGS